MSSWDYGDVEIMTEQTVTIWRQWWWPKSLSTAPNIPSCPAFILVDSLGEFPQAVYFGHSGEFPNQDPPDLLAPCLCIQPCWHPVFTSRLADTVLTPLQLYFLHLFLGFIFTNSKCLALLHICDQLFVYLDFVFFFLCSFLLFSLFRAWLCSLQCIGAFVLRTSPN